MHESPPADPAETYENYFVPAMFLPWARVLLRHALLAAGERVLDVACGTGIVSRETAPLVGVTGEVVAMDINSAMLAVARASPQPTGAAIRWQEGNAMALPFADGSFDVVFCQHGLQFFPDRPAAVREMRRVLKPGGRAVAIVLQALALHPVFEALMTSVASHLALPLPAVSIPFALSDAETLRALFAASGFSAVNVVSESITVRFPGVQRFVPLAVVSSAAAIPAFAALDGPARATLVNAVSADVASTIDRVREGDAVTFPMFANVVTGIA